METLKMGNCAESRKRWIGKMHRLPAILETLCSTSAWNILLRVQVPAVLWFRLQCQCPSSVPWQLQHLVYGTDAFNPKLALRCALLQQLREDSIMLSFLVNA